jgi:hypothetical protein
VSGSGLFEFEYRGTWKCDQTRAKARGGSEHLSAVEGNSLIFRFEGHRLQWYASKENCFGIAAVTIDDGPESLVDLYTYCTEPQYCRLVYDSGELAPGLHSFGIRVTAQKRAESKGVTVSSDHVLVFV